MDNRCGTINRRLCTGHHIQQQAIVKVILCSIRKMTHTQRRVSAIIQYRGSAAIQWIDRIQSCQQVTLIALGCGLQFHRHLILIHCPLLVCQFEEGRDGQQQVQYVVLQTAPLLPRRVHCVAAELLLEWVEEGISKGMVILQSITHQIIYKSPLPSTSQ